jgi:hypothetical protein
MSFRLPQQWKLCEGSRLKIAKGNRDLGCFNEDVLEIV